MNLTNWKTPTIKGVSNLKLVDDRLILAGKIESLAAVKELVNLGADTFIDLKAPDEHLGSRNDCKWVHESGANYINLPVRDLEYDITFDFHQRMKALLETSKGKVVIYCMSSNRVGYWFGRYLAEVVGLKLGDCYEYALKSGMCSDSACASLKSRLKIAS